jgi:catechol 2,3-dioxygenase-like lactoylglutathione lyase family enzyme
MIKDIAFVAYPVTDMARARKFYEGILGLTPSEEFGGGENGHWVEYNIGAGTLSLGVMDGWKPSADGASVSFEVDDFDKTIEKLKAENIIFALEPQSFPSCKMAIVKDPDGSGIIIHKKA